MNRNLVRSIVLLAGGFVLLTNLATAHVELAAISSLVDNSYGVNSLVQALIDWIKIWEHPTGLTILWTMGIGLLMIFPVTVLQQVVRTEERRQALQEYLQTVNTSIDAGFVAGLTVIVTMMVLNFVDDFLLRGIVSVGVGAIGGALTCWLIRRGMSSSNGHK